MERTPWRILPGLALPGGGCAAAPLSPHPLHALAAPLAWRTKSRVGSQNHA